MTGQQLYDNHLTKILDNEPIDTTLALSFFNLAKTSIERRRPWRFLLTEDASQSTSASDTYLSMKTLPSDFSRDPVVLVGTALTEYFEIPYEQRRQLSDTSKRFYLDIGAGQFALTGTVATASTIYFNYIMKTASLADISESFSSRWKDDFLPLIAYQAAALFRGGTDFDDNNARMSEQNQASAQVLYHAMLDWDIALKLSAMQHAAAPLSSDTHYGSGAQQGPWRIL